MEVNEVLEIMHIVNCLKQTYRHCTTDQNRMESVADHCFSMAFMAIAIQEEFPDYDLLKVLSMTLIHDLGEAFTGDIPTFIKTKQNEEIEKTLYLEWINQLSPSFKNRIIDLLEEMEALETKEAKLYKALDKMDALISHNESDLDTWLPLEYDLQYSYGKKECTFHPYICRLREAIDKQTTSKIEKGS